jgi:hypothetical protein
MRSLCVVPKSIASLSKTMILALVLLCFFALKVWPSVLQIHFIFFFSRHAMGRHCRLPAGCDTGHGRHTLFAAPQNAVANAQINSGFVG